MGMRLYESFFIIIVMFSVLYSSPNINEKGRVDQQYRLIKLHYKNSSGEKGVTSFEYDRNGVMFKAYWNLLDKSRHSQNYYTYDKNCNLLIKYREFSDGLISTQLFEYNQNGNLINESFERSDSVTGVTYYEYDKNNKLLKADCKGLNGWFHGIIQYQYDENGNKIEGIITRKGKKIGAINYTYDEFGNLEKEYWDFDKQWNQTFIYEYDSYKVPLRKSYTSSNVFISNTSSYRLVKEDYDYNNETGGPSFFEYEKGGILEKKVFERSDGLRTETAFEYNDKGILKKSYRKYSNGSSAIYTYEFNCNRKLIRRKFERSDGVTGSEFYEYDKKGNLIKADYDNFDTWLTGTITFHYDQNGMISKGYFKGKNKFDADILFKHDEYGNVIKIHWDFSFGKTQTYMFDYEKMDL